MKAPRNMIKTVFAICGMIAIGSGAAFAEQQSPAQAQASAQISAQTQVAKSTQQSQTQDKTTKAKPKHKLTAAEAGVFYTGKPYDKDTSEYIFAARNYDAQAARWTATDPSGFPDGVNNNIYANNIATMCFDRLGLDVYQITNSSAVQGAGHSAMIAGSGNSYTYQSYGSGSSGSGSSSGGSSNNVTTQTFTSLADAMTYAQNQGYDNYCQWNTSSSQDQAALNAMTDYANNGNYNAVNHNCQDAVNAGLEAAGVDYWKSSVPNIAMSKNSQLTGSLDYPNNSGKVNSVSKE